VVVRTVPAGAHRADFARMATVSDCERHSRQRRMQGPSPQLSKPFATRAWQGNSVEHTT
jgi:hypothetical protein